MGIIEVLKRKTNKIFFTTPSHGGKFCITHKFYQWYKSDISEVNEYNPQDALLSAENRATNIYKTKYTKFLTNGSTSGIIAAVLSCCKEKKLLIWDNAHPCHKNAGILANAQIINYELPLDNDLGVFKAITPNDVLKFIKLNSPHAIIITSPTYEGFVADIPKIKTICKQHNVKLIVDEAHGALYPFSDKLPKSAVRHADYTIQSLHKTAGGLNPTALLHSNDIDPTPALNLINTTSPSYPMLATIETNINYLNSKKGRKKIDNLIESIKELDLTPLNDDITKILIKKEGLTGLELSEKLYNEYGIEDERTNEKTTMLLCGLGTDKKMLKKLRDFLTNLVF